MLDRAGSRILIVDDDPAILETTRRLLLHSGYGAVRVTTNPSAVPDILKEFPAELVILDLNMPGHDGFAVLNDLRGSLDPDDALPVLVMTGSSLDVDRQRALEAGAADLMLKPFQAEEFELRVRRLLKDGEIRRTLSRKTDELETLVQERTIDVEKARDEMLRRLILTVSKRDGRTGKHSVRVGMLAARMARSLGWSREQVGRLKQAAWLHDIGKIAIPDAVLGKCGRLTASERRIMQSHTIHGARILTASHSSRLRVAEQVALRHHERWDGGGYPDGLAGEAIPLAARIVAVADVFDALGQARPYRAAWSREEIMCHMASERGKQFDPALVDCLFAIVGDGKAGVRRAQDQGRDAA